MAVIAIGSRPATPDVTKFFELPAPVDRRDSEAAVLYYGPERRGNRRGRRREKTPYIRNSYLHWGLGWK